MSTDLSKLSIASEKEYGELVDDPLCVYGFEMALSVGQLIDFGEPANPVMDCIEHLSTRKLVHSRLVSLFFVN